MKRLHVHVAVKDLAQSVRFYSTLFGAESTRRLATAPEIAAKLSCCG